MLWYYARNDQRFGPVEEAELHRLAAAGQISPTDLVWRQDFPDWRRASEVDGLFPAAPRGAMPPPPPPAAFAPPPVAPPGTLYNPYSQPPQVQQAPQYADFGSRFGAFLIDFVILFVGGMIIGVVIALGLARSGISPVNLQLISFSVGTVFNWLYYAFSESSTMMATPGKKVLGMVVTDLQGQRIGFGQATGRYFGRILSGLVIAIGYFAMLWSPMNQTWHDQMAGTLVLKTR
jgi:uncharacterized RDD family membrane protein YckC